MEWQQKPHFIEEILEKKEMNDMKTVWQVGDIFESKYDGELFKIIEIDPEARYSEKDKVGYIGISLFGKSIGKHCFGKDGMRKPSKFARVESEVGRFEKIENSDGIIRFCHDNKLGVTNDVNFILAFTDSVLREVEGKKVKVTIMLEQIE